MEELVVVEEASSEETVVVKLRGEVSVMWLMSGLVERQQLTAAAQDHESLQT